MKNLDNSNKNLGGSVPKRNSRKSRSRKGKRCVKASISIISFLIIAAGVSFYFIGYGNKNKVLQIDQSAIEYTVPDAPKNENPEEILVPYFSEITTNSSGEGLSVLSNPEGNPCYFIYKLTLVDSEEVIYESDLIKPGMAIIDWRLNTKLKTGEYEVMLEIEAYWLEDSTERANGTNSIVNLIVEE